MPTKSKALDAVKDEIPVLLNAIRAGAKQSLPRLCRALCISVAVRPDNLLQQWRRWAPTNRQMQMAGEDKAPKLQQIPNLTVLIQIHRASVNLGYVGPEIPVGAERLWMFLGQEFKRRQTGLKTRMQNDLGPSLQTFADSLIRTLAGPDTAEAKYDFELWETLPDVLEQFAHCLVSSMNEYLFFDPPPEKLARKKFVWGNKPWPTSAEADSVRVNQRRSRLGTRTQNGYKVGAKIVRDSIKSMDGPLNEFADFLEDCQSEQRYQEQLLADGIGLLDAVAAVPVTVGGKFSFR